MAMPVVFGLEGPRLEKKKQGTGNKFVDHPANKVDDCRRGQGEKGPSLNSALGSGMMTDQNGGHPGVQTERKKE